MTGLYAAGKDEVTKILIERGFREINVDKVGHLVLGEKKAEVAAAFGDGILDPGGDVDRRALGAVVFRDDGARARLEALLHPRMKELVAGEVRRTRGDLVVNAAILFPMGLAELVDAVIVVRAPLLLRICRARRRDGAGLGHLLARMRAQKEIIPQPPPPNVDIYYVWNTRNRKCLKDRVEKIASGR
ncbi:MAG: dephospho-CoA kinase [Spirochaetales bacterium]|nr:dephospho-CoA kinase [Spirochaetales bacterium]